MEFIKSTEKTSLEDKSESKVRSSGPKRVSSGEKSELNESLLTQKIRDNPWILSTIVLAILSILLIFGNSNLTDNSLISEDEVGEMLVGFYEAQGIEGLKVVLVEEDRGFYKVETDYQGQTIPFYITKTGYLTGNSIIPLFYEAGYVNDIFNQTQEVNNETSEVINQTQEDSNASI